MTSPSASAGGLVRRVLGRLFRRTTPSVPYLTELDDIRAFLEEAPQAATQQSEINWGPLRNGFGSRMKARLLPGGEQKGSRPTPTKFQKLPFWKELHRRKQAHGRTLYVRGHLSHDEAGGPGLDYNLVPLTAAVGGDFGANHANLTHRYLVEGVILWAYRNMHGNNPTISEVNYEVIPDYNRPPRPGTQELQKIADAYKDAAQRVSDKLIATDGSGMPTHQEIMDELALNSPSPHLNDAMLAVEAEGKEDWNQVHERIVNNKELWEFEDQHVPSVLHITYSWVENGVAIPARERIVMIDLPTSLAARFK